jgi:hypothetical protein
MLDVAGSVHLEVDGVPARLEARGGELRLEVGRLNWLRRSGLLRRAPGLARVLRGRGLTLRVVWRGWTVLSIGAGAGPVGRLVGRTGRR